MKFLRNFIKVFLLETQTKDTFSCVFLKISEMDWDKVFDNCSSFFWRIDFLSTDCLEKMQDYSVKKDWSIFTQSFEKKSLSFQVLYQLYANPFFFTSIFCARQKEGLTYQMTFNIFETLCCIFFRLIGSISKFYFFQKIDFFGYYMSSDWSYSAWCA